MHPRISMAVSAGAILAELASAGFAATPEPTTGRTTVRSGNHQEFGRVIIDTNGSLDYRLDQNGDKVVLRFADDVVLGSPPPLPHNVTAIRTDGPVLELTLKRGTLIHSLRVDGRIVLDVVSARDNGATVPVRRLAEQHVMAVPSPPAPLPAAVPAPLPAAVPAPSLALAPRPATKDALAPLPEPKAVAAAPPAQAAQERPPVETRPLDPPVVQVAMGPKPPEADTQVPPGRDALPENDAPTGLRARRVRLPKGVDGSAFLVPFESTTAAASFRRGSNIYVVFDERRPVDMGALKSDPLFGAVSIKLLPNGTLLTIPLPAEQSIGMTQTPQGWRIAAVGPAPKQQPITAAFTDGRLSLAAQQPGDVVSLADPESGATLLVGTQHRPGQGVAEPRETTEFILHPTLQGVVVEPLSDTIVLKQVATGFNLSGKLSGLALSSPASITDSMMDAARLTRRLAFSTMPVEALMRRTSRQLEEAANASPLRRGRKHRAAAESFLALGLAAEAESLLQMASEQDPTEAASADNGALTAIAALLAGRPQDAEGLADPRLDGTDEIALWRGVRQALRDEGSPVAATVFAATAPLALQYPKPIRDRILPLMVETMIQGGEITPAARLLEQRKTDPKLAYARALMRQAEGDTDQALDQLDALANGHDQFDRARAAFRAVELRLAARKLDRTQAADALDKLQYAWRGDERELALRERVAELRGQTGAWRVALSTLRQAEADFPEQAPSIHNRLKEMFGGMIRDDASQHTPPLEFVATVDENIDLVPESGEDAAVEQLLAERLLALDLPTREKPVLAKLIKSANSPAAKARFGFSLAAIEARAGDDTAALANLDTSEGPELPPELAEDRTILRASAVAHSGHAAAGAAMLASLHTASATEARAQIWEKAADWSAAEQALLDNVALTLPETGMLNDPQMRVLLRLATATARANDDAGLAVLREKFGNRLTKGPLADMFRLLTIEPIRTTADIKRSKAETSLAASLPEDLRALGVNSKAR